MTGRMIDAMSESPSTPLPVVLAGARGHGRWHVENIRRLQQKGIVRLVGIDIAPEIIGFSARV